MMFSLFVDMDSRYYGKKTLVFYTLTMLILISASKWGETEATTPAQLTNEKQLSTKQLSNQQQKNLSTRTRTIAQSSPLSNKHSRTSTSSFVRLSKPQYLDPFYRNEPPLFVTATRDYFVDVATSRPGKRVTIVHAIDADGDRLEYQLKQASVRDASLHFTINSTSGELKLSAKQFIYTLSNSSFSGSEEDQEEEENNENEASSSRKLKSDGRNTAAESALNLYFLNVAVNDGYHDSTVELNIHVTNSTLMKLRAADGSAVDEEADVELQVKNLEKIMRDKSRVFFDSLNQAASNRQVNSNSSIVVYPEFVNPTLNIDSVTTESSTIIADFPFSSSQSSSELPDTSILGVTPTTTTATVTMSLNSPQSPPSRQMISASSFNEHLGQQPSSEPIIMNLIIVMCSCLMIILVLLMFIIPLTVKKLRRRIKHVEMQHEHLSQKTSNVSSIIGSSLTSTAHHHPSLSQFTLGSNGSDPCPQRNSSSLFRQSSLGSAMTFATMSPTANHFNRVDNGSIANPVYLHQHRQHYQQTNSGHMHQFKQASEQEMMIRQQMLGLQTLNMNTASENVYSALSDEFYSTIQADAAPNRVDRIINQAIDQKLTATTDQCNQFDSAPIESRPDSCASSPTLRSLTRFLSLPARHYSMEEEKVNSDANHSSAIKELEMQLGFYPFSTLRTNQVQQNNQQQFNARTIARTCNVDREQTNRGWELERHRLRNPWVILDEGQFGQVWRCKLSAGPKQPERLVAVKSLKKNAIYGERCRKELLAEIDIMKLVCDHPNVVKLLHCCTLDDSKPILLVMEYIEQGKLQSYLEKSRINHHYSTVAFSNSTSDDTSRHYLQNHQLPSNITSLSDYLTSQDLMKFIYHVAKGMEYISSKCIVHRDLASRNILVNGQKVCKIGDFGMARHMQSFADIYERHSGNCKIPVRWMAPEVLLNNSFTTKSDVFSFGILMWEIITLGSTPYTHLKTEQVIDRVARNGERPDRPDYCHPQLYRIMSRCWQPEPSARPSFKDLVDILGELVLSANNYIELDQYPDHDYYNIPKTAAPDELL